MRRVAVLAIIQFEDSARRLLKLIRESARCPVVVLRHEWQPNHCLDALLLPGWSIPVGDSFRVSNDLLVSSPRAPKPCCPEVIEAATD